MVAEASRPGERTARERGQMVVLGAIALAVVVFGIVAAIGALEAEPTTETGVDAGEHAVVESELERGIGCLLENADERTEERALESAINDDLEAFADRYRDARAHSSATSATVELEAVGLEHDDDAYEFENATIRVTADSADRRTDRMRTIEAGCPEGEP